MSGRKPGPGKGADDGSDLPTLRLRIANDIPSLCTALTTVDAFLDRHGVGGTTAFTVRLAAEEIVTNVINDAYTDAGRHEIELDLRLVPGLVIVRVADDGRAFDPLAAPGPDLGRTVEEKAVGGVGIHLVRTLAERLEYARIGSQNVLMATVRIESGG